MITRAVTSVGNRALSATVIWLAAMLLAACQPQISVHKSTIVPRPPVPAAKYNYRQSTLFFDKRRASLSMRTTLKKDDEMLVKGYQFQFRSRRGRPVKISNIVITVAGKRIFLEPGIVYLPSDKASTFNLSIADSEFVRDQIQAILLFEYQDSTKIALIEKDKLIALINR